MVNDRTITVVATVAELRAVPGPEWARYVFVLELGRVFRWVPLSALTHDGRAVITSTVGGFSGAWLLVRPTGEPVALGDGNATIGIGDGAWRRLATGTLTAHRTATLSTTNAAAGDEIEVTRLDVEAFTYALVNGGPGAGTLVTLPASLRSFAVLHFDGTNWLLRRSALML